MFEVIVGSSLNMKDIYTVLPVLLVSFFYSSTTSVNQVEGKLLYITVATNETDGFKRFVRSARVNGIEPKVLGMGELWKGGDMMYPGGGFKIGLVRTELEKHKNNTDLVVLFSDSYDVIVTGGEKEILDKFYSFKANVVFSTEDYCWPDKNLKKEYPSVLHGYQYLNSGAFIGYAPQVYAMLRKPIDDKEDDQLYYTKLFLDKDKRQQLNIKLDTQAKLFQNLNGNMEDVALDFQEEDSRLTNTVYNTMPVIIHGNGLSKQNLNSLGNYLAKSWVQIRGCIACDEGKIRLEEKLGSDYPQVLIAVFIVRPTPFLEDMLAKVANLAYPKRNLHLFVYNNVPEHDSFVKEWMNKDSSRTYKDTKIILSTDAVTEADARNLAIDKCLATSCYGYFSIDSEVQLDNPKVLQLLFSYNRPILSPIMTQVGKVWSTFWGAVSDTGYYVRSSDYFDIVNGQRTGIWNVPYIYAVYLILRPVLENPMTRPKFSNKSEEQDIVMTRSLRKKGVFMYAVNIDMPYGHLVHFDAVALDKLHGDLWQVAGNNFDWEQKYLHPKYYEALGEKFQNEMPCNDVYWFPIFSERFAKDMIDTVENYGVWSGGRNDDPRIAGGYENVPTDDIHMNQVGFEQEWLYILKTYIKPLAEKVYIGYNSDAKATMNFVVRYIPTKQSFLRPHHDSSTYTLNVGLNRPGIDYEGGGSNFIRQNCSVKATKVGWALMHPGRLTHYHEGLKTTKGTRYILISFIDP